MGWIGSKDELMNVLQLSGVDRDPDGKYCVGGQITSFMGAGEEYVVGDEAVAFINGKAVNLCSLLEATNGLKVKVI